jgi:2-hydroxy-6-oxonona-2,4-dienedioate hydrolase
VEEPSPSGHSLGSLWVKIAGKRVLVRTALDQAPPGAPAIVLVHGLMVSSLYMEPFARTLAPFCRVYAPDLPGTGESEKPDRVLDTSALADALAAIMDTLALDHAALYGNSYGSQVIARLAIRHPDRVDRLVLEGATADRRARSIAGQLWRGARDLAVEPLSLLPRILGDYLRFGVVRGLRSLRYMLAEAIERDLPKVLAPTLVVAGMLDPIAPPRWAEELVRLLPEGQLVLLPATPHAANFAAPVELARVVLPFLGVTTGALAASTPSSPRG